MQCTWTSGRCLSFDSVATGMPHGQLLLKLQEHGIDGKPLGWMRAFLTNRTQQVLVEGVVSAQAAVTSGVLQGYVLGPLLFLLYINNIPDHISSSIKLFADDCKVCHTVYSSQARDAFQEDLNKL